MSEYILEIENLTKEFPGVRALENVGLKVKKAKSTLFAEKMEPENQR